MSGSRFDRDTRRSMSNVVYGITCFALFFSFFGTVLGGLWGDDSWGRFWGWDPKENGALMIVLWNAVVLHARWAGIARERGIAILAVLGNVVVLVVVERRQRDGCRAAFLRRHRRQFAQVGCLRRVGTPDLRWRCIAAILGRWEIETSGLSEGQLSVKRPDSIMVATQLWSPPRTTATNHRNLSRVIINRDLA